MIFFCVTSLTVRLASLPSAHRLKKVRCSGVRPCVECVLKGAANNCDVGCDEEETSSDYKIHVCSTFCLPLCNEHADQRPLATSTVLDFLKGC